MSPKGTEEAETAAMIAALQTRGYVVIPRAALERSLADGAPTILGLANAATNARALAAHFQGTGHLAEAAGLRELVRLLSEFVNAVTVEHRAVILSPRVLVDSRMLPVSHLVDDECTGADPRWSN